MTGRHLSVPEETTTSISLAQLCRSTEFQIRSRLCKQTVKRYASAIKAGQQLPPLNVSLVDGVPCLVDGYHRAEALELLGYTEVEAVVTTSTKAEAQWMAAKANTQHGLPLKSKELRKVFGVFIRTKQYRKGRGKLMSYREIGQVIGRTHNTIRNWMEKDFPKLFREYGGGSPHGVGGLVDIDQPSPDARDAIDYLCKAREAFARTSCAEARDEIRQYLQYLCKDLLADWVRDSDF